MSKSLQQTATPAGCSCLGWAQMWTGIASTQKDTEERRVPQLPVCTALVFLSGWSPCRGAAPRLSGHDPLAASHRLWWAVNILKCQRACISPSGDETFLRCSQACSSGGARDCRALLFSLKSTCNSWAVSSPMLRAAKRGDPPQQAASSVSAASLQGVSHPTGPSWNAQQMQSGSILLGFPIVFLCWSAWATTAIPLASLSIN